MVIRLHIRTEDAGVVQQSSVEVGKDLDSQRYG
jgi:hypothetical protein